AVRGGTDTASAPALNLADRDDGLTLERDPLSHLDRSQLGRLRTSRERASLDDRRATPHPMELTFVTTGAGERATRLVAARFDPSRGSLAGALPSTLGAHPGRAPEEAGSGPEPEAGGAPGSGERAVSAAGVIDGARGREHRRSATVTLARPGVPRARAAVPALRRASPADTVDSDEEVSSAVRSLLHASTAGGRAGSGPGGQTAPRAPGSGAVAGQGSRSTPVGTGPGALRDPSRDPRATGYFRAVERQLEPYWRDAFPEWAVSAGRGGVAVVGFTIAASGAVGGLRLVRTSGVAEFDRNVMTAIERAAPFGPLPALLGPGPLTLRVAFDATNPAVGRDGPGSGRGR
ncbi:MAG: TonB family protein, partial [Sorangiineae bacterium]|nr:TonB family protein [Sorangiineae bacterium]